MGGRKGSPREMRSHLESCDGPLRFGAECQWRGESPEIRRRFVTCLTCLSHRPLLSHATLDVELIFLTSASPECRVSPNGTALVPVIPTPRPLRAGTSSLCPAPPLLRSSPRNRQAKLAAGAAARGRGLAALLLLPRLWTRARTSPDVTDVTVISTHFHHPRACFRHRLAAVPCDAGMAASSPTPRSVTDVWAAQSMDGSGQAFKKNVRGPCAVEGRRYLPFHPNQMPSIHGQAFYHSAHGAFRMMYSLEMSITIYINCCKFAPVRRTASTTPDSRPKHGADLYDVRGLPSAPVLHPRMAPWDLPPHVRGTRREPYSAARPPTPHFRGNIKARGHASRLAGSAYPLPPSPSFFPSLASPAQIVVYPKGALTAQRLAPFLLMVRGCARGRDCAPIPFTG